VKGRTTFSLLVFFVVATLLSACQVPVVSDVVGEDIVATRERLPEPTPGVVEQAIVDVVGSTGLAGASFLGLAVEEWVNLGTSLLIVLGGYLIGVLLLQRLYDMISRRFAPGVGQEVRDALGSPVRWLITIWILDLATARLILLHPALRRLLLDVYIVLEMIVLSVALWRAIDLTLSLLQRRIGDQQRFTELEPALVLLSRLARVFLVVMAIGAVLSHFGINVAALTTAVGIGGLALSLAARDTIADAIAGILILVDRPFRVGDRIEIERANTWGDVVDIGLRTTRIRTRDNRLVIVPNSIIGSNQIINYSYPDPFYRIQVHVGIAYGTDVEFVRQLIVDTVSRVEGVLPEMGVDALYMEMGDSAMIFRVRWWIETYADTRRMEDRVNTALQKAFDQNGIVSPYPTQTVILQKGTRPDSKVDIRAV
jgi:MscS family membrane protein